MKKILIDSNIFCIFIFILIVSANFLAEVFPCRIQNVLRSNMLVKHLFGLFTMIFFVVLSSGVTEKDIFKIAKTSILLYILFILISKSQVYAFYFILVFLGITYIINIMKDKEKENIKGDEKTDKLINEKINNYDNIMYMLYLLIIITTIIGVILYIGEKKIEYKNNFNYLTFFLGKPKCKGKSPSVSLSNAFKEAFK
jgi:hypothetical protein